MTYSRRLLSGMALTLALGAPAFVAAEDIDLFVGNSPSTTAQRPNVLFIIDNSAYWSDQAQHWPGGLTQGQSELRALKTVIGSLSDKVNVGLMLFTEGAGGGFDGTYVRYAIRQMTDTNKGALQELIGDDGCAIGSMNSLNGTPNCIYKQFNNPAEQVGRAKADYSAGMFEAFKYFGGYTNPANAQTGIAGSPVDASHFGALRYAGNLGKTDYVARLDAGAFTTQWSDYNPPITTDNNCAKNYIIFIGNGFSTQDAPATLLSGVQGDTTQLTMPLFSTTTTQNPATLADQFLGTSGATCYTAAACATAAPSLFPGRDVYTCQSGTSTVKGSCTGSARTNWDVFGYNNVTTTAPTDTSVTPPSLPSNPVRYGDEWAKYLYTTDVNGVPGQQNVITYTIDVFKDQPDAGQNSLLFNMAKAGGGKYYQAKSEDEIKFVLDTILTEIQAVNSVFAAASLPVSATNRAQNENQVFFGMFRPDGDAQPRWYGNLKRYQVSKDAAGQLILAGQDGITDVIAGGFFSPCAASFWTSDSGTYWDFSPKSAGQCGTATTSVFSDLPDGPLVEKGGAAEVVRLGNEPPQDVTNATNTVKRTMLTCTDTGCAGGMVAFNTTNVSPTRLGVTTTTDQQNIINYTQGQDVALEKYGLGNTSTRPSIHGDVVHSRPLPVNYGGSTGIVVYYGTNDGVFRAVQTSDGKELWSFIAPEHHARLKRLLDNRPLIAYPNVLALDPQPSPAPQDKDYFFDGTPGLYQNADNSAIWIFPTMRRGGRMLYAFDITNPASPTLKWHVGCPNLTDDTNCRNASGTSTDFKDIGQTWSTPNVTKIKGYNGGNDAVLVVGGGYDACEDENTASPSCGSAKGRKVYVIDANTGTKVATGFDSFTTDRSVSADIALVDRDFDGLADAAYVVDLGGNLYRIDFINQTTKAALAPAAWTMTKIAHTQSSSGRKFMFAPAVLPSSDRVFVTFGSGDRERPLITNYPYTTPVLNRFYMFMDLFAAGDVALDSDAMGDITASALIPCLTPASPLSGWRMDLIGGDAANPKVGEQTVTSSLILGGNVFFNTNRPVPPEAGQCNFDLGEARGYSVSLLCGAVQSVKYIGGGLPISPVQGTTTLSDNSTVTFCIGCANTSGPSETNPFTPGKVKPVIAPIRSRIYWYRHGDK